MSKYKQIEELAKKLVLKLDQVHSSAEYQDVWSLYHSHFGNYSGPQYAEELENLAVLIFGKEWRLEDPEGPCAEKAMRIEQKIENNLEAENEVR